MRRPSAASSSTPAAGRRRKVVSSVFTLADAFSAIDRYAPWGPSTKSQYKSRLYKVLRNINLKWKSVTNDALLSVDLVPVLSDKKAIDRMRERVAAESSAPGVVKDYLSPIVGLFQKAATNTLGSLLSDEIKEYTERVMKEQMGVRSVSDVQRSMTDEGHEPYENIMAAAKWYRDRKLFDQHALVASMYGDNPILVRDNYGEVKMYYGDDAQAAYKVPAVNFEEDSYYDVQTGRLYITVFKTRFKGYRPYDIKVSGYTKNMIDRQLHAARANKDYKAGYRHWLFTRSSDPTKAVGKLGKNAEIDKILRKTDVRFKLDQPIGPNILRSSYITYRVNRPGMTQDELILLARDMKHSFAVQQLIYKRQRANDDDPEDGKRKKRK